MILSEIDMGADDSVSRYAEINANAQGLCYLFIVELGRFDNDHVKKICIDLVDEQVAPEVSVNADKIASIELTFDFDSYWALGTFEEKKKLLADSLFFAVFNVFDTLNIECSTIYDLKDRLYLDSLSTEFLWGKRAKWNISKTLKAEVFYRFDMEHLELGVLVSDKFDNVVSKKVLESFPPHFMFVEPFLGALTWNTDGVKLESKDKMDSFFVKIDL